MTIYNDHISGRHVLVEDLEPCAAKDLVLIANIYTTLAADGPEQALDNKAPNRHLGKSMSTFSPRPEPTHRPQTTEQQTLETYPVR
jgi:hypothetical protein